MEPLGVGVFGHFLIAHGHFLKSFDCSGSLFAACWLSLVVIGGFSCSEACGILDPLPGMEPTFPTLEGGFLTTGQPGNSLSWSLIPVALMWPKFPPDGHLSQPQSWFHGSAPKAPPIVLLVGALPIGPNPASLQETPVIPWGFKARGCSLPKSPGTSQYTPVS